MDCSLLQKLDKYYEIKLDQMLVNNVEVEDKDGEVEDDIDIIALEQLILKLMFAKKNKIYIDYTLNNNEYKIIIVDFLNKNSIETNHVLKRKLICAELVNKIERLDYINVSNIFSKYQVAS